jgi:hypothetical protein
VRSNDPCLNGRVSTTLHGVRPLQRLIPVIAFVGLAITACASGSDELSCVAKVGVAQTKVSLNAKVGSSAVVTVDSYRFAFSILDDSRLQGVVTSPDGTTLLTTTAGRPSGAGGAGTPAGQLEYSCAP